MNITPYSISESKLENSLRLTSKNCPYNTICEGCSSRHLSLCNVLDNDDLDSLSRISTDLLKTARQTICSEDETAEYLYNIRRGCVRVSKMLSDGRRQITGFLFAGDFFGLSCKDKYNYTAEAITEVEICRFPRGKIIKSFKKFPELGDRVFDMTRTELNATHDQMLLLGRKTAKEKLCSFLLKMRKKSTLLVETADDEVHLPMSRSDIADYLGLTVETVSRQFTNLNKNNLIALNGAHRISLVNTDELTTLANGT